MGVAVRVGVGATGVGVGDGSMMPVEVGVGDGSEGPLGVGVNVGVSSGGSVRATIKPAASTPSAPRTTAAVPTYACPPSNSPAITLATMAIWLFVMFPSRLIDV